MIADAIESLIRYTQGKISEELKIADDKTIAISCSALFQAWNQGDFAEGDIRTDPETGYPYSCITPHNSLLNPDWTIKNRTLWAPFHSRSKKWALPWEQPTGAHDIYKSGDYMIWTDGFTYLCKEDTNFSPDEYPSAWEIA